MNWIVRVWTFAKKAIMRSPNTIVSSLVFLGIAQKLLTLCGGSDKIKT